MRDSKTVVVDDDDSPTLCFHDPSEYPTNPVDDVIELTVAEAREKGAVACSKCFSDEDNVLYNFPYLQRGVA